MNHAANAFAGESQVDSGTPEKSFSPLVGQFLQFLKLEKHFSDYTVKSYGADLIQFGQFLSGSLRNPSAAEGQRGTLLLGFALTEALGIFSLLIALLLLFAV